MLGLKLNHVSKMGPMRQIGFISIFILYQLLNIEKDLETRYISIQGLSEYNGTLLQI